MGLFDDLIPSGNVPSEGGGPMRLTVTPKTVNPRDRELLVRTVLGEAANEPDEGQRAVAAVVQNRLNAGQWGDSIPKVVLARNQFEPWNTQQGRSRMYGYKPDSEPYQRAAANVDAILAGDPDPTNGATHFFAPVAQAQLGRPVPKWAQGEPQVIGGHNFYGGRPAPTEMSAQARGAAPVAAGAISFDDLIPAQPAAPVPPAQPSMGQGRAAAIGGISGFTANFADELAGLSRASGLPQAGGPAGAIAPIVGGARLLYENTIGTPGTATQNYQQTRDRVRAEQQTAEKEYPGTYMASQIGGTVATLPFAPAAQIANAPRIVNAMATGAAYGGLAGAGSGEGGADTLAQAGNSALVGGAVGAAVQPLASGAAWLGNRIAAPFRGAINPEQEASRRVVEALRRDNPNVPQAPEVAARTIEQARAGGTPLIAADAGGPLTRNMARSAANASPEAQLALEQATMPRVTGQKDRFGDVVRSIVGGNPNATATQENLLRQARVANRPAYRAAYDDPRGSQLWDEGFEQLTFIPEVQNAIRRAIVSGRSQAGAEGFRPVRNPFEVDRQTGGLSLRTDANGNQMVPNVQFWDHVQRELRATGTREALAAQRALNSHLDELVPTFASARAGAAAQFGAQDALQAGREFALSSMRNEEARRAFARLNPAERDLFRQGFASDMIEKIREVGDRTNITNKAFLSSPASRERIELALGPDGARRLESFLRVENIMTQTSNQVNGNSSTIRQLVQLGLSGGYGGAASGVGYGVLTGDMSPSGLTAAAITGALLKGGSKRIDQNVARRVGEMLASHDPQVLRQAAQMAARSPVLMNAIRNADNLLSRSVSQSPPDATRVLPSIATGRADGQNEDRSRRVQ